MLAAAEYDYERWFPKQNVTQLHRKFTPSAAGAEHYQSTATTVAS